MTRSLVFPGFSNVKCHEDFKTCMNTVQKSGKVGFSQACPYNTSVRTMTQGMDMAILFSYFGNRIRSKLLTFQKYKFVELE